MLPLLCAALCVSSPLQALEVDSAGVTLPDTMGAGAGTWEAITFGSAFSAPPVVIATPGPSPGGQPFTIRIQNITTTGFEAQVLEPQGSNQTGHYYVEMTYLAVEEGTHGLPDGSLLIAGTSQVQAEQYASNHGLTSAWETVFLRLGFPSPPSVLAQIQTMNNETGAVPAAFSTPFLTVAIDQVSVNSFSVALERSKVIPGSVTTPETVGWIAISSNANGALTDTSGGTVLWESVLVPAGAAAIGVSDGCETTTLSANFSSDPPAVISMNTRLDDDGGWARVCSLTTTDVGYQINEDWYVTQDRSHPGEDISVLVFESGIINLDLDADDDGIDDTVEDALGTSSSNPDTDGDGICDGAIAVPGVCVAGEDAADETDTDGDGIIDALDDDSDGDEVPDAVEGVNDANGNGVPAFRDPAEPAAGDDDDSSAGDDDDDSSSDDDASTTGDADDASSSDDDDSTAGDDDDTGSYSDGWGRGPADCSCSASTRLLAPGHWLLLLSLLGLRRRRAPTSLPHSATTPDQPTEFTGGVNW